MMEARHVVMNASQINVICIDLRTLFFVTMGYKNYGFYWQFMALLCHDNCFGLKVCTLITTF